MRGIQGGGPLGLRDFQDGRTLGLRGIQDGGLLGSRGFKDGRLLGLRGIQDGGQVDLSDPLGEAPALASRQ